LVSLEPMDEATFEAWRAASIRDYAQDKIDAGTWLADDAVARAEAAFSELLPDGRVTEGQEIRSIVSDGEPVGFAWFAAEERPFGRVVFVYDIGVDPAQRRKGHAQAALMAIEAYARNHGCVGVQLHVFGGNLGARRLYLQAGYVETDVTMLKRV
jgi:GNAT superfamily N-acetyltransferase